MQLLLIATIWHRQYKQNTAVIIYTRSAQCKKIVAHNIVVLYAKADKFVFIIYIQFCIWTQMIRAWHCTKLYGVASTCSALSSLNLYSTYEVQVYITQYTKLVEFSMFFVLVFVHFVPLCEGSIKRVMCFLLF